VSDATALDRVAGLVDLGRWEQAVAALRPVLATAGAGQARAHGLHAQCLLALGRPDEAIAAAHRAAAIDPHDEWPQRLLAIGYRDLGQNTKADVHAKAAVKAAPWSVDALHVLGIVQIARKDHAGARQTARQVLEVGPESATAHLTAAAIDQFEGIFDEAEEHYRIALEIDPHNDDVALSYGWMLSHLGRHEEADELFLAAGRSNPTRHDARRALTRFRLPFIGAGTFFVLKFGAIASLRWIPWDPTHVAATIGVLGVLATVIDFAWRQLSISELPDTLRRGLEREMRRSSLRWLPYAAAAEAPVAVWSATTTPHERGGAPLAMALTSVALPAVGVLVHRYGWLPTRRQPAQLSPRIRARSRAYIDVVVLLLEIMVTGGAVVAVPFLVVATIAAPSVAMVIATCLTALLSLGGAGLLDRQLPAADHRPWLLRWLASPSRRLAAARTIR
jgi:Tfp pilus assembly protein PilF